MTSLAVAPAVDMWRELLDEEVRALGDAVPMRLWERVLLGPVRGVLARPGKQFRAHLVHTAWRLAGGDHAGPPAALTAAIEILHAGSLVIDDIEDDAELRRGEPALHRQVGVPLALNTGNWMYFYAFDLVDRAPLPDPTRLALYRAMRAGVLACHRGQALDVGLPVTTIPRGELRGVVASTTAMKSGALTRLAAELGAIAAGAAAPRLAAIGAFGGALGEGLQMLDDLGAVTSSYRSDKAREDLWQLRPTWAWAWAAERADDATWFRCVRWAQDLAQRRADPEPLARCLGGFAATVGRVEARARLAEARAAVAPFADAETAAQIGAELARLEASYG